jgi:cytochrome c-type biogenesis protein CcmH
MKVSWILLALLVSLQACGGEKTEERAGASAPEAAISGTITVDPSLAAKVPKEPLLMIMASRSSDPNTPAIVVKRVPGATFPHEYKLTADDITLVGSTFDGRLYVTARIDPAGMVGAPRPGTFEGTTSANPVPVGSSRIDIVISKAY